VLVFGPCRFTRPFGLVQSIILAWRKLCHDTLYMARKAMFGGDKGRSFQSIVMIIATVLLIISLIIVAIVTLYSRHSKNYPPVISDCPDYWADQSREGNAPGSNCVNVSKIGSKSCADTMDFSTAQYRGSQGLCAKVNWAMGCNQTWDGVTDSARAGSC